MFSISPDYVSLHPGYVIETAAMGSLDETQWNPGVLAMFSKSPDYVSLHPGYKLIVIKRRSKSVQG